MAKKNRIKEIKTNAIRIVEANSLNYETHRYDPDNGIDGVSVSISTGMDPNKVFKTLVVVGASKENYVCVIPVNQELDLKKAAKILGEKNIEMIPVKTLLNTTGYIKGGCSPIGMKKLFKTIIHETAKEFDTICVSGGRVGLQIELNGIELSQLIQAEFGNIIKKVD